MTRLLLIIDDPNALNLTTALSSAADLHVHHRPRLADARGALSAGAFEIALFAPTQVDVDFFNEIAAARSLMGNLPLIVLLPAGAALDAQQKLLTAGADLVLFQPIESPALAAAVERLASRSSAAPFGTDSLPLPSSGSLNAKAAALSSALTVLRDFSQVLGYSLDHRQLTHHFILKLREVVGLSRIAIFLESRPADALPTTAIADNSNLPCAAAVGVPADLVECFALSRKSGLGRLLTLQPQILRAPAASLPPLFDGKIVREFEVLGGQVAIPVNDRERTLGVAVLGGRITGGQFSDDELLLVYHLLEELGLAVKNSWLHSQLVASHRLFGNVLNSLTVGALVAGPGSQVVYSNRAIARFLRGSAANDAVELTDLPAAVAAKLHEVIERGATIEPFFHETAGTSSRVFRATVLPLGPAGGKLPQTAMLLLEDFTQVRAAQRAEIDASNFKLISLIARRFAHEIRNSLVPLTTHEQLFDTEINDPDFRSSLKSALVRETRRIQRFTDQMLLLARSDQLAAELTPLDELLRSSFEKSRAFTGSSAELEIQSALPPLMLRCNRASLAHAFQEIFLNGLQSADGTEPHLTVALGKTAADGRPEVEIRVRDNGSGFAPESATRATEPFFTTRNTGVGLGLTIARRVIEAHHGQLEVHTRATAADADLTIRLPLPS